jgi:biotin operon repressor
MSKIKEYIDAMKEQGIDILAVDDTVYTEYDEQLLEKQIREGIEEMNKSFTEDAKKLEE